jgi:hypothetical protein
MSLLIADPHADIDKLEAFLDYRPEIEHIVGGDVFDNKVFGDAESLYCWNRVDHELRTRPDKFAYIWGNHDIAYMYQPPFTGSGFHHGTGFSQCVEPHRGTMPVALVRDGFLITHAGLAPELERFDDVQEQCDWLNAEWFKYITYIPQPYCSHPPSSPLNYVGKARGGNDPFGGIFWLDWTKEPMSSKYDQIFGHTKALKVEVMNYQGRTMVAVDSVADQCFNTVTREVEHYGKNV